MKKTAPIILLLLIMVLFSCKSDDSRSCTTCNSPQTQSFEVCEDGDGNATVNGEDTGVRYDVYISDLIAAGASCGS